MKGNLMMIGNPNGEGDPDHSGYDGDPEDPEFCLLGVVFLRCYNSYGP